MSRPEPRSAWSASRAIRISAPPLHRPAERPAGRSLRLRSGPRALRRRGEACGAPSAGLAKAYVAQRSAECRLRQRPGHHGRRERAWAGPAAKAEPRIPCRRGVRAIDQPQGGRRSEAQPARPPMAHCSPKTRPLRCRATRRSRSLYVGKKRPVASWASGAYSGPHYVQRKGNPKRRDKTFVLPLKVSAHSVLTSISSRSRTRRSRPHPPRSAA
jgi:hypothetical protein